MQGFASKVCHQISLTIILCPSLLRSTILDLWIDPLLTCCILAVAQQVMFVCYADVKFGKWQQNRRGGMAWSA